MDQNTCAEQCGCDVDFYDVVEQRLMQMTFWAHKEVLFEKIKDKIEKEEGAKLEKIADLLVSASKEKADKRQESEKKQDELSGKLREIFEN